MLSARKLESMTEAKALNERQGRRRLAEALARAALSARNDEAAAQAVATPYADESIPQDNVQTIADDPRSGMPTKQNYLSAFRNLDLMTRGANIPQVFLDLPPSTVRMGDVPNDRKGRLPGRTLKSVPTATPIARDTMDVPPSLAWPSYQRPPVLNAEWQRQMANVPPRNFSLTNAANRMVLRDRPGTEAMAVSEFQVQPPRGSLPLSRPNAVRSREEMRRQWHHTDGVNPATEALAAAELEPLNVVEDSVIALGSGAVKGLATLPGVAGEIEGLGRHGINFVGKRAFGRVDNVFDEDPYFWTSEDWLRHYGNWGITFYEPKTKIGRLFGAVGENVVAGVGPGGPLRVATRVVPSAVAGEIARDLAPEKYGDLTSAIASILTGRIARQPFTAKARVDDRLGQLAAPSTINRAEKLGPKSFLFEANNNIASYAKHAVQQNAKGARNLMRSVANRAENVAAGTKPISKGNPDYYSKAAERERRFTKTHNTFQPDRPSKLSPKKQAAIRHEVYDRLPEAMRTVFQQRFADEMLARARLRGNKSVQELQRLNAHQWWHKWGNRASWLSGAQSAQDLVNGIHRAID